MKSVKVGLLGLGTVGQGVLEVLQRSGEEILRRAGRKVEVVGACVRNMQRSNPHNIFLTTNADDIINNPEIDVIIEVMGGFEPAKTYVMQALAQGKHVITANKALIATSGNEIFAQAEKKSLIVAFEAAVAGGIPIIKTIREGFAGNKIEWVAGIINGTSNYIMSEMREKGREFSDVLKEAQALGYAESDPTFDIEGIDAAHKLTILASIAFGIPLQFDKVFIEGISKIQKIDVAYAEEFGFIIKHLGIAKMRSDGVELRVHPTLIPKRRLIANVNGVMNAILVKGDAVGPVLSYGAGAGSAPTASAVVADLVDVVRMLHSNIDNRVPYLAFQANQLSDEKILPQADVVTAYYLRIQAIDQPGVLAKIAQILGELGISVEAMMQKQSTEGELANILIMTHKVKEMSMLKAVEAIENLSSVAGKVVFLRVETFSGS